MISPEAQQDILREFTALVTENPAKALRWVPEEEDISDAKQLALSSFGTLMQGVDFDLKSGLNPIDQIEAAIVNAIGDAAL